MIRPLARYCLSRTGKATLEGKEISIPCILFATGNAHFSPKIGKGNGFDFGAAPNPLSRVKRGGVHGVKLPAHMHYSHMMEGAVAAHDLEEKGKIAVCYSGSEGIQEEIRKYASDAEMVVIANAAELVHDAREIALTVSRARIAAGFSKLIYAPGIATPANISMLIFAGCDIADSVNAQFSGVRGTAFIGGMEYDGDALGKGICPCPACVGGQGAEQHNMYEMRSELARCATAIENGQFREFVEERAAASAWNSEFLRYLDQEMGDALEATAPNANISLNCITEHSFWRPEVRRYVSRVSENYEPPPLEIALLVPCSMRKPYYRSRSHILFERALQHSNAGDEVHVLTVTSPLGVVPEELETVFPAANYDIPVTGVWRDEEKTRAIRMLSQVLSSGRYRLVISHLEDEREFVNEMLREKGIDFVDTSGGRTRSEEALRRLSEAVSSAASGKVRWSAERFLESIAVYQFGRSGKRLLSGARCRGRYPDVRIMAGGVQRGMLTSRRGCISLTLEGAAALGELPEYTVVKGDFELNGNLFAAGVVSAGRSIRVGDEVIVKGNAGTEAVGVAAMSSLEMESRGKGMAVSVRHRKSAHPVQS